MNYFKHILSILLLNSPGHAIQENGIQLNLHPKIQYKLNINMKNAASQPQITICQSLKTDKPQISINATKDEKDTIKISTSGNKINIEYNKPNADHECIITLSVPVREISAYGKIKLKNLEFKNDIDFDINGILSGDIYLKDASNCKIKVDGTTNLNVSGKAKKISTQCDGSVESIYQVEAKELQFKIDGVTNLNLSGEVKTCELKCDGTVNIDAQHLSAKEFVLKADGFGKVQVAPEVRNIMETKTKGMFQIS